MSLRSPPAPHPARPLIDSVAASLWGFARATGVDGDGAEIAMRAAFADAWPADPPTPASRAALLAALGRATASVKSIDAAVDAESAPIASAFRSLPWATQVWVWGRSMLGLPSETILAALGIDGAHIGDPARQLLAPYLRQLANGSPPACADALRRAASNAASAEVSRPDDLDPHIAGCATCRSRLPIRVAEELQATLTSAAALPSSLADQIAIDHQRLAEGLPLTVEMSTPKAPARRLMALAGAAVVIVVGLTVLVSRPAPQRPRLVAIPSASTTGGSSVEPTTGVPPPTEAGSFDAAAEPATTATPSPPLDGATTTAVSRPASATPATPGRRTPIPPVIPLWRRVSHATAPPVPSSVQTPGEPGPTTTLAPSPTPVPYVPPPVTSPPPTDTSPPTTAPAPSTTDTATTDTATTALPTTSIAPTTTPPGTDTVTTAGPTTTADPTTTAVLAAVPTTSAPPTLPLPPLPLALAVLPGIGLPLGARHRRRRLSRQTARRAG